jgi:excisionase family DNA binding protein
VETMDRQTLDVGEVAQLLGVHPNSVRRAVTRGKLPVVNTGVRRVLFSRRDIERLLAAKDEASPRRAQESVAA